MFFIVREFLTIKNSMRIAKRAANQVQKCTPNTSQVHNEILKYEREKKIMNASVAIQVLPKVNNDEETIRIVDAVIDYIKSTGLSYFVGPCETSIEGDYDELMEIIKQCQKVAVKAGAKSVSAYVKINYRPEGEVLTIEKKVTKHHQ